MNDVSKDFMQGVLDKYLRNVKTSLNRVYSHKAKLSESKVREITNRIENTKKCISIMSGFDTQDVNCLCNAIKAVVLELVSPEELKDFCYRSFEVLFSVDFATYNRFTKSLLSTFQYITRVYQLSGYRVGDFLNNVRSRERYAGFGSVEGEYSKVFVKKVYPFSGLKRSRFDVESELVNVVLSFLPSALYLEEGVFRSITYMLGGDNQGKFFLQSENTVLCTFSLDKALYVNPNIKDKHVIAKGCLSAVKSILTMKESVDSVTFRSGDRVGMVFQKDAQDGTAFYVV